MQVKPNTDNHVHLRGALSQKIIYPLLEKYNSVDFSSIIRDEHKVFLRANKHLDSFFIPSNSYQCKARSVYSFQNLNEFFASYLVTAYLFQEKADLEYLIVAVADDFISNEIIKAEVIVSPYQYLVSGGLCLEDVVSCLSNFKSDDLKLNWVIDPVRDKGEDFCIKLIESCFEIDRNVFKAINLGGSEDLFPAYQFKRLYRKADELGLELRMHAGETGRVDNLEYAVKELGCNRIGHGISVVKDKELLRYFSRNGIELEICISSNLALSGYSIENYPLREIFDNGIKILICTDDPGFLETNLEKEFLLVRKLGFSDNDVDLLLKAVNFMY